MNSLIRIVVFWLTLAALIGVVGAAEPASGVVFEDLNGNGIRDAGEPGIPRVRVSDGRQVVLTDNHGRYQLRLDDEAIVFVTKPAGYMTPVNAQMIPKFYYIHQPDGSPPGLRYAGIEPTGPLPETIDFSLRRQNEPRRFEAILFADTQPQTSEEVDYIRDDVVAELLGTSAKFGMTMGDIVFDDLSIFPRYLSVVAQIGIPWYNVPGNHEINLLAENDRYSLETFKRFFGPPYYSFEYGGVHFVVLDNIDYAGNGESDPADIRGSGGYVARITERQLDWLENDLEHVPDDKLVLLAMHAPLRTYVGEPGDPRLNTQNRRELFELLAGRRHLYAVAGHTHTTEHHYFGKADGFPGPGQFHHHVLSTVSGSWWSGPIDDRGVPVAEQRDGTPNGYHILEVDGVNLTVRYKGAGKPADRQMRIVFDVAHHRHKREGIRDFRPGAHLDGRLTVDEVAAAGVVVNLFDGGPRSAVQFTIDDRPPVPMNRVPIPDPYITELYLRNEDTKKSWVDAVPSSHVWIGDLPDDLGPGVYTLTVRARDEFGRVHHAHKVVEIMGTSATQEERVTYPEW